jgi:hypothetical protein
MAVPHKFEAMSAFTSMIELSGGAQELFDRGRRRQQGRGRLPA